MSEYTDFLFGNDKEIELAYLDENDLKHPEGSWQSILTPEFLADKLVNIDKDIYKKGIKALTLFNVHILKIQLHLIDEEEFKNLYFIADTEEKYNMIHEHFPQIHVSFLKKSEWNIDSLIEKVKEFKVKKFDVVFTNPPYSNNMDLDLIETLFDNDLAEKVIAVHPGKFLFNHNERGDGYSLRNSGHLTKAILGWYNKPFKTHMVGIHCISVWEKNNNSKTIELTYDGVYEDWEKIEGMKKFLKEKTFTTNVNEITIHPCFREEAAKQLKQNLSRTSIKDLLCKLEGREVIDEKTGKPVLDSKGKPKMIYYPINPTPYGLIIPSTRPGIEGWDKRDYDTFFSPFGKDVDYFIGKDFKWDKTTPSQCGAIFFDTEEERKNAWDYLRLKNTRWNVSLVKPSSNMVQGNILCGIPVPKKGFKKHYSEQDVCKENGISKELWNYIDTLFSSTYYEDYEEFSK